MYHSFYNLNCKPFSLLPDPAFLFPSKQHEMALTLLRYSLVSQHPFTVITGEVGSGKTTLINKLLDEIVDRHTVGLMSFTDRRVTRLGPWVLRALKIPRKGKSKVQQHEDFIAFLHEKRRQGRSAVLIIDEAQNLGPQALEFLRVLSNVNVVDTLFQVILVGQPEFRNALKRPDLRQLNQRIAVFYKLKPLSAAETREYISHRIQVAGGHPRTFDPMAVKLIWRESEGIARRINTLCDLSLVYGFACGKKTVDPEVVNAMLSDRLELAVATEYPKQQERVQHDSTALAHY